MLLPRLSRTVALVTGGSSGLGAGAVQSLLEQGAKVMVADLPSTHDTFVSWARTTNVPVIDASRVDRAADTTSTPAVAFVGANVTDHIAVTQALDAVEHCFGEPVNTVVNCAGIAKARKMLSKSKKDGTILVHPLDEFTQTLTVNTVGTFLVSSLAVERMMQRSVDTDTKLRGCLIHTASIAAYEGQVGQVAYAASKGAIVGLTLPMARDLAPYGIRVMTIAPGLFATPLLDGLPDQVKQELGATVPCPSRFGTPPEFGHLVVSILDNAMLNGSVIRLDGALRMPP